MYSIRRSMPCLAAAELVRGLLDRGGVLLLVLAELRLVEHARVPDHGVHGRAQLVAHVREELGLGDGRALRHLERLGQVPLVLADAREQVVEAEGQPPELAVGQVRHPQRVVALLRDLVDEFDQRADGADHEALQEHEQGDRAADEQRREQRGRLPVVEHRVPHPARGHLDEHGAVVAALAQERDGEAQAVGVDRHAGRRRTLLGTLLEGADRVHEERAAGGVESGEDLDAAERSASLAQLARELRAALRILGGGEPVEVGAHGRDERLGLQDRLLAADAQVVTHVGDHRDRRHDDDRREDHRVDLEANRLAQVPVREALVPAPAGRGL
jgi:hypothetical protein